MQGSLKKLEPSAEENSSAKTLSLSRMIGEAVKANAPGRPSEGGKPTIEEVSSWIRLAKS